MASPESSQEVFHPDQQRINVILDTFEYACEHPKISIVIIVGQIVKKLIDELDTDIEQIPELFKNPTVTDVIKDACYQTIKYAIKSIDYVENPEYKCELDAETITKNFDQDLHELVELDQITNISTINNGIRKKIRKANQEYHVPEQTIESYFLKESTLNQLAQVVYDLIEELIHAHIAILLQRYETGLILRSIPGYTEFQDDIIHQLQAFKVQHDTGQQYKETTLADSTIKKVFGNRIKKIIKDSFNNSLETGNYENLRNVLEDFYNYGLRCQTAVRLIAQVEFELEKENNITEIEPDKAKQIKRRNKIEASIKPIWEAIAQKTPIPNHLKHGFFDNEPSVNAIQRIATDNRLPLDYVSRLNDCVESTTDVKTILHLIAELRFDKEAYMRIDDEKKETLEERFSITENSLGYFNLDDPTCRAILSLLRHNRTAFNWTMYHQINGTFFRPKDLPTPQKQLTSLGIETTEDLLDYLVNVRTKFKSSGASASTYSQDLPIINNKKTTPYLDLTIVNAAATHTPLEGLEETVNLAATIQVAGPIESIDPKTKKISRKTEIIATKDITNFQDIPTEEAYQYKKTFKLSNPLTDDNKVLLENLDFTDKEINFIEEYLVTNQETSLEIEVECAKYLDITVDNALRHPKLIKFFNACFAALNNNFDAALRTLDNLFIVAEGKTQSKLFNALMIDAKNNNDLKGTIRLLKQYVIPAIVNQLHTAYQVSTDPQRYERRFTSPTAPPPSPESL